MTTEGRVMMGLTIIGSFVIRFDDSIVFSLRNRETMAEALERASQHGMTIDLRLTRKPAADE